MPRATLVRLPAYGADSSPLMAPLILELMGRHSSPRDLAHLPSGIARSFLSLRWWYLFLSFDLIPGKALSTDTLPTTFDDGTVPVGAEKVVVPGGR